MHIFIYTVIFTILLMAPCRAMPTGEYENMLKNSPYFRKMDENLSAAWREATNGLNRKDRQWFLEIQREWIRFGRDDAAEEYKKQGYGTFCAYALATKRQIMTLRILAHNLSLSRRDAQNAWPDDFYDDDILQDLPAECEKRAPAE